MNLFKSFSVYVVNNILNAFIPILLIPVLTKYLSTEEYGIMANVQVFITFTLPFVMLAINGAISTAYFRETKEQFPSYVKSSFSISVISAVIVLVLLLAFSPVINKFLEIPPLWISIIPFICLFQTVAMVTLVLFQARNEPVKYGIFQISMTLVNLSLSIFFVAVVSMGWKGRILGIFLSFFVFMIVGMLVLRKMGYMKGSINKLQMKDALWFGLPLIPHTISGPVVQMLDRPMISHYIDLDWAGIYTVAFQIGVSVNLAADAFNKAWIPHLFGNLSQITPHKKKKIVKQSYLFMGLFLILPLLLYIVTPLIFKLFIDPKFDMAQEFVLPISFGAAFGGMYYVVTNYIFYEKKTKFLAVITFSSAVLSVGLNLILIPWLGTVGAAYTYLITNIAIFIAVWILSNRVYPMPWFGFSKKTGSE